MNTRLYLVAMTLGWSATLAGCGTAPGFYTVQGKVLYKGEPASGAVVYFHEEGVPAAAKSAIPFAIAEQDGTFRLACDGVGEGCRPGKYSVLVEWKGKPGASVNSSPVVAKVKGTQKVVAINKRMAREGIDQLQGRYFDLSRPLLHAEVLPQSNSLPPFEVGG
jgi:hypothetical protein